MRKRLTIALVAHDHRKADMVEWCYYNSDFLSKHQLVCTGTTGTLIKEAFEEKGINEKIYNRVSKKQDFNLIAFKKDYETKR